MLFRAWALPTAVFLLGHAVAQTSSVTNLQNAGIQLVDTDDGLNVTDSSGNFTVLTSYLYNKCSKPQKDALKEAIMDANLIAFAGVKRIARQGATPINWIDFSHEAAIDYFGPQKQNSGQQRKILTTLERASYAYRGWGWSDWYNNKYVQLNCDVASTSTCQSEKYPAYYTPGNKDFKYPLISFCPVYFTKLKSLTAVEKELDKTNDKDQYLNVMNIRNQASTMLHEWLHMNWGTATIVPGGADDNKITVGPKNEKIRAYKAGRSKFLAERNVTAAANNNDNYVYYSLTWYMLRRYGIYPRYPVAWDPKKTVEENQNAEKLQPGFTEPPSVLALPDDLEEDGPDSAGLAIDDPAYPASDYPDWYQPVITATLPTTSPATLPAVTPPPDETTPPPDAITTTIPDSSGPAPTATGTATATESPSNTSSDPPSSSSVDADSCDVSYKVLYDEFEIRGKNFDPAKFDTGGSGLKEQLKGCGDLKNYHFELTPTDPTYQWYASGTLPIGTKACVGRAVVSAGGADHGNCHGAG